MRTLKFRVWHKGKNEWVHGPGQEPNILGECILLGGWCRVPLEELNDLVVLQYTGVNDKNNKEVYDGDILRNELNGNICFVRWATDMEYAGWSLARPGEPIGNLFINKIYQNLEVIGNIFENPERLK